MYQLKLGNWLTLNDAKDGTDIYRVENKSKNYSNCVIVTDTTENKIFKVKISKEINDRIPKWPLRSQMNYYIYKMHSVSKGKNIPAWEVCMGLKELDLN